MSAINKRKGYAAHGEGARVFPQYDFGKPSTFSAMKFRIMCGLTGAMRGMKLSRK
jgi:hypothetical protein